MTENNVAGFWQAQSKLMWSRVQTASVIEAGALVGWYRLWEDGHLCFAIAILGLGALLLAVVSLLMRRDSQYMDACEKFEPKVIPSPNPPLLRLRGRWIAFSVPLFLALCNIVLALTFPW